MLKRYYLFLFFIFISSILIPQKNSDSPVIILISDYMEFRIQPEDKLYPHLQFFEKGELDFSISLPFTNYQYFFTDSLFLIDTTYFFGFDKNYMEYRRIYSYDEANRIKNVKAEVSLEEKWDIHQITELSYNKDGNIVQINFGRNEERFDSIIIYYLYNEYGLLEEENASLVNESDSLLKNGWKKKYSYDNKNLVKYTFEKIGKPNWYETDSVKCKYTIDNLLIERTDFWPEVYVDSSKFIWRYNNEQQLIEYNYFTFSRSDTLPRQTTLYEYNEIGKILKQIQIERNKFENVLNQLEWEYKYKYNETGQLDSIYQTGKIHLENSDSLLSISSSTFNYNSNEFLVGSQMWTKYEEKFWGRRVIYTRDSNNNVSFAQEEYMAQGIWKQGPSIRIVYRQK